MAAVRPGRGRLRGWRDWGSSARGSLGISREARVGLWVARVPSIGNPELYCREPCALILAHMIQGFKKPPTCEPWFPAAAWDLLSLRWSRACYLLQIKGVLCS